MEELKNTIDGLNKSIADIQTKHKEEIKRSEETNKMAIDTAISGAKTEVSAEHKITIDKMVKDFDVKLTNLEKINNKRNANTNFAKDSKKLLEYNKKYFKSVQEYSKNKKGLDELIASPEMQDTLVTSLKKYITAPNEIALNGSLTPEEKKAFNTVISPEGGYFVHPAFLTSVIQKEFDAHQILQAIESITVGSAEISEVADWNEYDDAQNVNELANDDTETTDDDYEKVSWHVKEVLYPKRFTRNSLEDSFLDVESYVIQKLREGMARKEAAQIIAGNGVDKPKGFLQYANGTTRTTIEQVTSESVGVITWDDVLSNLPSALRSGYHGNASFAMKRQTFFDLLKDVDGVGKYQIGNQIQFLSRERVTMAILGYPILWEGYLESVATSGKSVLFGDFKKAYRMVRKAGVSLIRDATSARSIKLTLRERKDGKLKDGEAVKMLVIQ